MRLDLFPHPLGEQPGGIDAGTRQQEEELLAAQAADAIDRPRLVPQNLRELLENFVAGLVPVGVVHRLEAIEVAHHAGERLSKATCVGEHLAEPMLEVPAVVESRQGVGLGQV